MTDCSPDFGIISTPFSKKLFRILKNIISTLAVNLKFKKCGGSIV